jgi:hypothetical protein
MGVWNDSLIALFLINKRYNIQFYNTKGELVAHYLLDNPKGHRILQAAFNSKQHKIFTISFDEENYYLNEYFLDEIK